MDLHKTLQRQLRQLGIKDFSEIPDAETWQSILAKINKYYTDADQYRYTFERSLEISSLEMQEIYEQLENERNKLQAILSEGTIFVDKHWRIQSVNAEAQRLLGQTEAEILQHKFDEILLIRPHKMNSNICVSEFVMENTTCEAMRCDNSEIFLQSSGSRIPVDFHFNPLHKDGKFLGGIILIKDISERLIVQNELEVAKIKAEQSNQAKSRFLANMSHEIRTPMNGVLGMVALLNQSNLNDEQTEYVNTIKSSGESLLAIINDILDFSKIEAGKLTLHKQVFNPYQLINDTLFLLSDLATKKNLHLEKQIAQELDCEVKGDPVRLKQILCNIVGNAIKFTNQGTVTIEAYFETTSPNGYRLFCKISDTGIGIPPHFKRELFKAFSQEEATKHHLNQGTGLGLSIASELVHAMGGYIDCQSEVGVGTEFKFDILLDRVSHDKQEAKPITSEKNTRKFKANILVAEDNPVNQTIILKLLTHYGCNVDVVANGEHAFAAFSKNHYDMVFMDCSMPVMDGFNATKLIRHWEDSSPKQRTPIIAFTANAMHGSKEQCIAAGMDDFLSKPIDENELSRVLSTWLSHTQ